MILNIKRFTEVDSADVLMNIKSQYDSSGVDKAEKSLEKLKKSFDIGFESIAKLDNIVGKIGNSLKDASDNASKFGDSLKSIANINFKDVYKAYTDKSSQQNGSKNSAYNVLNNKKNQQNVQFNNFSDATGIARLRETMNGFKKEINDSHVTFDKVHDSMKEAFDAKPVDLYKNSLAGLKSQLKDIQSQPFALYNFKEPKVVEDLTARFGTDKISQYLPKEKETHPVMQELMGLQNIVPTETANKIKDITNNFFEMQSSYSALFRGDAVEQQVNKLKNYNESITEAIERYKALKMAQDNAEESGKKFGHSLSDISEIIKSSVIVQIQNLAHTLRRTFGWLSQSVIAAGDYVESVNLYTMSVGEYAEQGQKWAKRISDALYLDDSEIYQYTGQFYNLTEGLGASAKAANLMSQNLTQLTYDMSSFLNIDVDVAFNKLMSAMSGQTKAVTNVGIAVQVASLQELAYQLGIEKSVKTMTQAEKTYLRYIQIMRSTTQMQGDLGRTIITPTNAMRLLKTQMTLLSRAIGQVFTPIVMKSIPAVVAFTQVLQDLASKLAKMFGYDLRDYLADPSAVNKIKDSFKGLGDEAEKSGKKMNTMLAPFDELNVVQTNKDGAGEDDSVLSNLEQYLTGYDMLQFYTDSMKDKIESLKKPIETVGKLFIGALITGGVLKFISGLDKVTSLFTKNEFFKLISKGFKKPKGVKNIVDAIDGGGTIGAAVSKNEKSFKLPSFKTVLTAMGELALVVGGTVVFVGVLGALTNIPGAKQAITDGVWALNAVFVGLASAMIPMAAFTAGIALLGSVSNIAQIASGLLSLAVVVSGLTALVTVIGAVMSLPGFNDSLINGIEVIKTVFNGLSSIALPLAGFSVALAAAGLLGGSGVAMIAIGLADLAIVIGGLTGIVTVIGAIMSIPGFGSTLNTGIDTIKKVFTSLSEMAVPIGGFTVALALAGLTGGAGAVAILTGLGLLAEVVVGLSIVLAAMGGISQIPGFNWIVGEGGKLLSQLGGIIGNFVGSIVGGLGEGISSMLPTFGTDIADFANNSKPFFEIMSGVDKTCFDTIKKLADSILTLTKADILEGLLGWATGKSSLKKFGKDLKDFAPDFKSYADNIKGLDGKVVENSANAAKALSEFANTLPKSGGLAQLLAGSKDLKGFGAALPDFGTNLKSYADKIKGLDKNVVTNSTDAANAIAEFNNNLPKSGGLAQLFSGSKNLKGFGATLPDFGTNLKAYSDNIKGIDSNIVSMSADAAGAISALANGLDKTGGLASFFTGDKKLSSFGSDLSKFGTSFKEYYNKIKDISISKITTVTNAISGLGSVLKSIKDNGLGSVMTNFGKNLTSVSTDITNFFNNTFSVSNANSLGNKFGNKLGERIKNSMKSKLGTTIQLTTGNNSKITDFKINAYAGGGYPDSGSLFYANENGIPEMVGRIGNKTAVANNDQIAQSLTNALVQALSDMKFGNNEPRTTVVNIGARKVYEGIGEYVDSENDRYGTNYVHV